MNEPTPDDLRRDLEGDLNFLDAMPFGRGTGPDARRMAIRRAIHAEAILNAPAVVMFADGREPTRNERHLINLLSWREKEAAEAKTEVVRLQRIIDGLVDRVAAQSDLLSQRAEKQQ